MFSFIKKLTRKQRTLLFTCFYAFFCNGTLSLMMGSAMPDIKAAYGLTDTLSGVLLSAHSIGNWAAGLLYGIIVMALGTKKSILCLDALAVLGVLMVILWGNPVFLFMAFLFIGMGRGSVTNFNNTTVNRLSGGSPAASNLLHGSFAIGAILTPMVFLAVSRLISWRAGMCFSVVVICVCLVFLVRADMTDAEPGKKAGSRSMVFLKNPSFLILSFMMFMYLCAEYSINGWLVTYIQSKQELSSSFADEAALKAYSQTMATLLWAIMLIGRLTCAFLSAKISQKKLIMISSFGVAAFFTLMLLSTSVAAVTVAVAGLGLCMAGICPMIYSCAAPFTNAYAMGTSALVCIGFLGGILMPTIVGALADKFGFGGGMAAILVSVVLLAVLAVANVLVKTKAEE